jgi:hypothetical protein
MGFGIAYLKYCNASGTTNLKCCLVIAMGMGRQLSNLTGDELEAICYAWFQSVTRSRIAVTAEIAGSNPGGRIGYIPFEAAPFAGEEL